MSYFVVQNAAIQYYTVPAIIANNFDIKNVLHLVAKLIENTIFTCSGIQSLCNKMF